MIATDRLYLDWNATAPLWDGAREAVFEALSTVGNASSVHAEGRAARAMVERVRRRLAERFGEPHDAVTFTSGGTEANATALAPGVGRNGFAAERLIVSAVEHPAVLSGGRFAPSQVIVVPVTAEGVVALDALEDALAKDGAPALVSVMAANNETGVVQPVADVVRLAHDAGATVHTDAVQAFGRIPDEALAADLITISGHKVGAPLGVGALIRRAGVTVPPLVKGGAQERGARAGTENIAAIAGFGAALDGPAADPGAWDATRRARDGFEERLLAEFEDSAVFGRAASRLPNTSLFAVAKVPAELSLIGLDLAGVAVSSGAACSSGRVSDSHVLTAMGVETALAQAAVRASVGPKDADVAFARFLVALKKVVVPMEANPIL
ncbi:MAG: cysteine desulfurase family protein [Pseudomonadota bacterium]